jgi:hypothetical protein
VAIRSALVPLHAEVVLPFSVFQAVALQLLLGAPGLSGTRSRAAVPDGLLELLLFVQILLFPPLLDHELVLANLPGGRHSLCPRAVKLDLLLQTQRLPLIALLRGETGRRPGTPSLHSRHHAGIHSKQRDGNPPARPARACRGNDIE